MAWAEHGYAGTWEMAEAQYPELRAAEPEAQTTEVESSGWIDYLKGISFALPLLISCVAMLGLHFSLWGGEFSADVAAAVAIGTVASFVIAGGFVQAMSRRGLFYLGVGQYRMCAESTRNWFRAGTLCITFSAVSGIAASAYFGWLPGPLDMTAAGFLVGLGLLWLSTGMLYMLERNLLVAAAILTGIVCVAMLHRLRIDLIIAQVVGIFAAAGFALLISSILLRRKTRTDSGGLWRQPLGRNLYLTWPYFVYGCLYYLFLFTDRFLAWTAHTQSASLLVQFRGDYETALDLALFAFIIQVGFVHYGTVRFYRHLKKAQRQSSIEDIPAFHRSMSHFYHWKIAVFSIFAIAGSAIAHMTGYFLGLFSDALIVRIALWSLAGFPFLVLSLWNVSLLFAVSRPLWVLKAITPACLVNLTVGYLCSRLGSYEHSVIGFTTGAIVFAAVSTHFVKRAFRRLDYYYFAAGA